VAGRRAPRRRRRPVRGRGRAPPAVAAGVLRRRHRGLFFAVGRAAAVARCGRCGRRRRARLGAAPAPLGRRGYSRHRPRRRRFYPRRRDDPRPPDGDARTPPRTGRCHRTGRRRRHSGQRLATDRRPRFIARPRPGAPDAASAAAHSARERRAIPGRPGGAEGGALSGAGPDPAGQPGHAARSLFRRDRRGRLQLWRRAPDRRAGGFGGGRLARAAAILAQRHDGPDHRGAPRLDRRRRRGADHGEARRGRGRGQRSLSQFRPVASARHRRSASRPRRRLRLLRRARRSGADPAGRAALSDQEDRGGGRPRHSDRLFADLRRRDPDATRLCHERPRLCRDPRRPAADLDADLRHRRGGGAGDRPGEPRRRQLSDCRLARSSP
jgi:hypothetical protein